MNGRSIQPGVYSGLIKARSSDLPGRDHTYTVRINGLGVEFAGVAPQTKTRWTSFDDTLEVVPFEIGTYVTIHAVETNTGIRLFIETSELPVSGECT